MSACSRATATSPPPETIKLGLFYRSVCACGTLCVAFSALHSIRLVCLTFGPLSRFACVLCASLHGQAISDIEPGNASHKAAVCASLTRTLTSTQIVFASAPSLYMATAGPFFPLCTLTSTVVVLTYIGPQPTVLWSGRLGTLEGRQIATHNRSQSKVNSITTHEPSRSDYY